MAEVYIAQDELLSRAVAVKILFPELAQDDQFVERFRREARAAASLNHHNIVSVYDFGEAEDSWFIVMEYVDGPTLRDIIRADGPMDPAKATEIAGEVAAALAAAHARGIVHRDVKPANVLIASAAGTVKVADFGIARAANARQALTMPGTVLGTATYLSPEQAQGAAVDHRTDIYSLGMVLYEMLAGRPPFTGDSPVAVAYQSVRETPPPPSTHNARVRPALDAVVMKAMAKDPAGRQQSAEELRGELLDASRAVDPEATVAIVPPVVEPTAVVAAGAPTSVLASPAPETAVAPPPVVRRSAGAAVAPEVYRRRRLGVIVGLAAVAILIILILALANKGGGSGTVAVPNVVGSSLADAMTSLTGAGLKGVAPSGADAADMVTGQDPAANAKVSRNSSVQLVVAAATSTTASTAATTAPPVTTATTRPATTTTATQAPTTTAAPATTVAPTTVAPTTSIVVSTSVVVTTTTR
jgi:serine/threonine-protein kinase